MNRLTISCVSCGQSWNMASTFSLYQQQSVESCPCPSCGAYTLCCHDPAEAAHSPRSPHLRLWRTVGSRPLGECQI